jgi:hypothetical protein
LDAETLRSFDGWMMTSPVTGVWELTEDRTWTGDAARVTTMHWWAVGVAWTATAIAWGCAIVRSRTLPPQPPGPL